MVHKQLIVALSLVVAATPVSANSQDQISAATAPAAGADARYCLRVDPLTGSQIETVQCWTRDEWADQDVDVDKEWAKEGVAVRG